MRDKVIELRVSVLHAAHLVFPFPSSALVALAVPCPCAPPTPHPLAYLMADDIRYSIIAATPHVPRSPRRELRVGPAPAAHVAPGPDACPEAMFDDSVGAMRGSSTSGRAYAARRRGVCGQEQYGMPSEG